MSPCLSGPLAHVKHVVRQRFYAVGPYGPPLGQGLGWVAKRALMVPLVVPPDPAPSAPCDGLPYLAKTANTGLGHDGIHGRHVLGERF